MPGEPLLTKGNPPDPLPKTFKLNCIGEYCPFGRQLRIFVALADIGFTSEFDVRTSCSHVENGAALRFRGHGK